MWEREKKWLCFSDKVKNYGEYKTQKEWTRASEQDSKGEWNSLDSSLLSKRDKDSKSTRQIK